MSESARVTSIEAIVKFESGLRSFQDEALQVLQQRGYRVWRVRGHSAIDQGRSVMATQALAEGYDELMWIDSDIAFDPDAVDRLRSHQLPFTCGLYPKKGLREMAGTLGISPAYLTDLEAGNRVPSEEVLAAIQKHYGVDEDPRVNRH